MKSIYEQDSLQNQYNALEIEWNSIKQSTSRSNHRNSTITPTPATATTTGTGHQLFHLYDNNSPKELMSLLQNENPPSSEGNRDQAAIEIIKQREADFDNFPIRGRRLFEESQGDSLDISEKSEVSTEFYGKGSEIGYEKQNRILDLDPAVAEKDAAVAVKRGGRGGGFVGKWMVCVVVMLFALGIVAFKCSAKDEQSLVPT